MQTTTITIWRVSKAGSKALTDCGDVLLSTNGVLLHSALVSGV
jgi:hypothetical protein